MNDRVKEVWGNQTAAWEIGRGLQWLEHPMVQQRINRKVSGDPLIDPYQHLCHILVARGTYLPVTRCFTLGCGEGELERGLTKYSFCLSHDAVDIADGAVAKARTTAQSQGLSHIKYSVADVNRIELPPNTYDVVFGVSSIHHVEKLERVFSQAQNSLKAGGYFFLKEYVGPNRFQWSDRQRVVVESLLQILPERYVRRRTDGSLKRHYPKLTAEEVAAHDPSEAVRSSEILKLLPNYFEIVARWDVGGTILHLLMQDIAGNFETAVPADMRWLKFLFDAEDAAIESGDLPSDFAIVLARKATR